MKRFLSTILALVCSLCLFVACGGDDPLLQGGGSTNSGTGSSNTGSGGTTQTYTITYLVPEQGKMIGETTQDVIYGQSYTLNALVREGYTGYWSYNGEKFEEGIWELTESITLRAEWQQNPVPPELDDDNNWTGIY